VALREQADVYHVHDPELLLVLLLLRICRPKSVLIFDSHESFRRHARENVEFRWPWLRYPTAWAVVALETAARFCSAFVAANPSIARNFPSDRTVEVSNFPSREQLPPRSLAEASRPAANFVFVGRIVPEQRVHLAIKALALLPESLGVQLTIVGPAVDEAYHSCLRSLPASERVRFVGRVAPADVAGYYAQATAAIIPIEVHGNLEDARPNKLFECLGCGTPVILTYQKAWEQFIETPQTGWLLRDATPKGLAQLMRTIAQSPEEVRGRGANARELIERTISWEHEATKLTDPYDRLTARSTAPN
jgi:glycosyltransferase involved in cell wall biosynthesis